MSGRSRALLTIDGSDGWAMRITDGCSGRVDPEADPAGGPLPAGVSHLLAADDALIPGRWGVPITLCGQQVRGPNAEDDDPLGCPDFRYCPKCVSEAVRWGVVR